MDRVQTGQTVKTRQNRGHSPSFKATVLAAAILAAAPLSYTEATGQELDPPGIEAFEIGAFLGLINDQPEFSPDITKDQFRRDALVGGRIGYTFANNVFVQAEASNALIQMIFDESTELRTRSTNGFFGNLNLGYNFQVTPDMQLFALAGAGGVVWDADLSKRQTQLQLNYGLGGRYFVTPRVAVRGDARMHHAPSALTELRTEALGSQAVDETLYGLVLSFGLSLFSQDSEDGDADGVRDSRDRCPGTRPGAIVGPNGCPLDGDGDGVPNGIDQCPNTPAGTEVGLDGCPADGSPARVLAEVTCPAPGAVESSERAACRRLNRPASVLWLHPGS